MSRNIPLNTNKGFLQQNKQLKSPLNKVKPGRWRAVYA